MYTVLLLISCLHVKGCLQPFLIPLLHNLGVPQFEKRSIYHLILSWVHCPHFLRYVYYIRYFFSFDRLRGNCLLPHGMIHCPKLHSARQSLAESSWLPLTRAPLGNVQIIQQSCFMLWVNPRASQGVKCYVKCISGVICLRLHTRVTSGLTVSLLYLHS